MMRRRTNTKGDPNRNTQLRDGEVQFEPASIGPLGHHLCFDTVALSAFVGRDPNFAGMVQLSINVRASRRSSSGTAWLSKEELAEYIAHLTEIHASLPSKDVVEDTGTMEERYEVLSVCEKCGSESPCLSEHGPRALLHNECKSCGGRVSPCKRGGECSDCRCPK